jgi:plastocyanin
MSVRAWRWATAALCALCLAGATAAVALGASSGHTLEHGKQSRRKQSHHRTRGAAANRHACRRRHHDKRKRCPASPRHKPASRGGHAQVTATAPNTLTSLPAPGDPATPSTGAAQPGAPTSPSGEAPLEESGTGGGSSPQGPAHLQVSAKEFSFTLSRPSAQAGPIVVELVNAGQDEHNLHIRPAAGGPDLGAIPTVLPSHHLDQEFNLPPGTYTLYCGIPAHEGLGMKTTFTVQ